MNHCIQELLICLSLVVASAQAMAEISHGGAENLMRVSGLWAQLTDVSRSVKVGMDKSPMRSKLSAADASRLEQAANSAFADRRMRQSVRDVIALRMSDPETSSIVAWYSGATGQMLTGLEEAYSASINGSGLAVTLAEDNAALENAPQARQMLISRLVHATRAAEYQVDIVKHVTIGTMQGLAIALNASAPVSTQDMQRYFDAQRPAMVASAKGVQSAIAAAIYATVSDLELEQYVDFLSSPSGRQFLAAVMEGMDIAFSQAAKEFGKAIAPKEKTKAKITG